MNTNLQTTTNKLVLDFHQRNGQTVLAKEYDKGSRFIPIQCMEHGEPFALDSSIEIQVKVLTPDNRALLEHSAVIQDDGSILLELTENMLYYPGKANVELIFYDFEHKKRLSPMKFDLLIDSSAYPDDRIISSDEFNALTDLLEKANADYTYVITAARESADAAKISEDNAAVSADIATTKATEATLSASNAENAANHANISANNAAHSETISANSAASALNSAKEAQSWAHGNTGIREGENTNNSKYWSEQSKEYADSWKGSLLPQGTIAFSQIPTNGNIAGHMYNINEAFVTDSRFKDGAGYSYPAGTNIYWTHDNKWDCLSGTLTMTLTQAEYNNLSNAEKMNGTIYYISDADNSLGNANGNIAGLMSPEDKEKLDNIEAGAQVNVQADWNVSDSNSDVYIKNKPQVMKNPSALTISLNGISQGAYDGSSQKNVNITAENIGADSNGTAQIKVSEHNGSEEAHSDIRNLITTLTSTIEGKANKSGDEFTGDVIFDNYLGIKAWPGYGNDVAKIWYNGNTKTLDFEGDVKNIDLNATSATNADTLDEKHASDFISKEGKDNIVKERFTVLSGTTVSGSGTGDTSKTGYLRVATLTIRSTYIDNPIVFEIAARGWNYTTTLYIKFKSVGNNDPDLASFLIDRKAQDKVYLHKRDTSIWDLYVYKSTGHGYSTTYSLRSSSLGITQGAIGIEHPKDVLLSTLPDGVIEPDIMILEKTKDADTIDGKHASDFVNKHGDNMIGDLSVSSGRSNTLNITIPCAGRIDEGINSVQDLSEYKTFLGTYYDRNRLWWNIISTRHGNGWYDGHYFGMYLRSKLLDNGDLLWGKQIGSTKGWQEERTLLDSVNYKNFCLPLSGGTITGDLGIPLSKANINMSAACCGRLDSVNSISDFSNYKTFLGSYNDGTHFNFIVSIRHGNGSADGYKYGLYLKSIFGKDTDLVWGQQNTDWTNERTLLDSSNYEKYCLPLSGGIMKDDIILYFKNNGPMTGGIRIETKDNDYKSTYLPAYLSFYQKLYGEYDYDYHREVTIGPSEGIILVNESPDDSSDRIIIKDNYVKVIDNEFSEECELNSTGIQGYNNVYIRVDNGDSYFIFTSNQLAPRNNGINDLGTNNAKWRNIYANNGTIQTSDRTRKTDINNLETQQAQSFINGLNPVSYKMIDGTSGRTHYGFIAQDIEELMNTLNIDSKDFAGFIKSPKKIVKYEDENGKKLKKPIEEVVEGEYDYALRYDEFIAPLIKVVQEQQRTIENQQITIENQHKEIDQIKKELSKIYSPM